MDRRHRGEPIQRDRSTRWRWPFCAGGGKRTCLPRRFLVGWIYGPEGDTRPAGFRPRRRSERPFPARGRCHPEALVLWERRERALEELLADIDAAEASIAGGKGRVITEQSMKDLANEVKQRGQAPVGFEEKVITIARRKC